MDYHQPDHLDRCSGELVLVFSRNRTVVNPLQNNHLPTPTQEDNATQESEEKPLFSCSECELEFTGSPESEQGKLLENLYQNDALTCPECGGIQVRWFD